MYVKRLSIWKIPSSMYAFSFIRVFPCRSSLPITDMQVQGPNYSIT